jgi:hypothetical protein
LLLIFPGPTPRRIHMWMKKQRRSATFTYTACSRSQGSREQQPPQGDHRLRQLPHHPGPCMPSLQMIARACLLRPQFLKPFPQAPPILPPWLLHHRGVYFVTRARCSMLCPELPMLPPEFPAIMRRLELQLWCPGNFGLPFWQCLHQAPRWNKMDTWSAPPAIL